MLKKIYRLSSVRLSKPKNIQGINFTFKTAENGLPYSRFGFVISKKIDKRATVRNSVKRKLSASIEEIFDRIESGNDFVFFPRPSLVNLKQQEVLKEINEVFKKEGFIK